MNKLLVHDDARAEYVESYAWYHERGSHSNNECQKETGILENQDA